MKIYQDKTTHNSSIFTQGQVTEEMVIRQQIHRLINEMPIEDVLKIFKVTNESHFHPYFRGMENIITVSIEVR